ncbi:DUF3302 domain-containing protein [Novipirellula artificiosorum]|uniref:Inner membrane protein YiaW n=1 Tax=Novipirellula artificiosorum TaxID=2528016 RepID=A0A5C6CSP5_9BACT|nr:DUF3302 domain-containing protein [Novipirellula artificiosorum]TWU27973.1 hypothetical protein Poly41_69960 [Novipirellula artificiosorum]
MDYQFEAVGPTLRIVTLVFMIVFAFCILGLLVVLAALPGALAKRNRHPQANTVNLLGWLGLPTGALWVVALAWAYWDYSPKSGVQAISSDLEGQLTALELAVSKLESSLSGTNQ